MRNYFLYSSSVHAALLAAALLLAPAGPLRKKPEQAYFIDFVGGGKITAVQAPAKAEPAPEVQAKAQKPAEDDFSGGALPRPSVLGSAKAETPQAKPAQQPRPAPAGDGNGDAPSDGALFTDSSNFPYPWYLAQVREALWNAWTGKMPSGGRMRATVRFTIRRNGEIRGAAVEKTSGNRLFDYAAEASALSAAPFPPLPDDFFEDTLTVHVEFKTVE